MAGYSNFAWYTVLTVFGAVLGFIASCIFLLIYYGMEYTDYVPESVRIKTSVIITVIIVAATVIIYFRGEVLALLSNLSGDNE